jgi:hypothetical protein
MIMEKMSPPRHGNSFRRARMVIMQFINRIDSSLVSDGEDLGSKVG